VKGIKGGILGERRFRRELGASRKCIQKERRKGNLIAEKILSKRKITSKYSRVSAQTDRQDARNANLLPMENDKSK